MRDCKYVVEDCVNRYPKKDCDLWEEHDHCNINPTFMEANCMLSCGVCRETGTGTEVTTGSNGGTGRHLNRIYT